MALYESMRRRFASFGMRDRSAEVDDFGMDAEAIARARPWLDLLYDRWWRVSLSGVEDVPRGRPSLFVANHSGLLPWDGLMIAAALGRTNPLRRALASWSPTGSRRCPSRSRGSRAMAACAPAARTPSACCAPVAR